MTTSLLKLKQLVSSRYGKSFELRPLMDLSKLDSTSETVVCGNDLYIPIVFGDQFLGAGVIPHGWELSDDHKKSISQLVRMILEPSLYNDFLERHENNLRTSNDTRTALPMMTLLTPSPQAFTTSLIHLQGRPSQILRKVAMQVHDFSGRWAFVPFDDVKNDINTALDISGLGGMTLYVENIETLPVAYQNLLAEYLSSPRSLEEPLILTASTVSLTELGQCIPNQNLLRDIQSTHLEVDKFPLSSTLLREVIELVFQRDETEDLH